MEVKIENYHAYCAYAVRVNNLGNILHPPPPIIHIQIHLYDLYICILFFWTVDSIDTKKRKLITRNAQVRTHYACAHYARAQYP